MAEENKLAKSKSEIKTFNISSSSDTMELASDIANFIKEKKLYQNIQGKEFVNVEGWMYAGSRLGILPVVEYAKNISTSEELKYESKVNLLNLHTGQMVGAGFAVCSNKEQGKKYYQEFAIMSMAQTRGIGKAYRNILAWIIRAAGYEPTPSEEMEGNEPGTGATEPVKQSGKTEPVKVQPTTAPAAEASPATSEAPAIKYASAKQKEEIIRLLNNPVITRQEKTKMLLNINKLDEERATQAIAKLKKVIEDREEEDNGGGEASAPQGQTFP